MRIERIRIDAFGRIHDLETGPNPLPGLVVVVGPNEAGKSTLFHFLTSMLYGFYPAARDKHPYAPWNGVEPSGSVVLRLDAGTCVEVDRRLLSTPSGRMETDGRAEDLRNRTLPWAEHIPLAVFRQVFAVTLAEMAGLDEETWAKVQDRILGSMGSADLRPARLVVADLEQEASEIWRPTRRGNQRARDLAAAVRDLRAQRREAQERDRRLRELVAERARVRRDLQEAREARQTALLAVDRVQGLIPIRTQLLRIAALHEDAGEASDFADMPADPGAEVRTQSARMDALRSRLDEVEQEQVEPRAAVAALDAPQKVLLDRSQEITAFLARAAGMASTRHRLAGLEQEIRDLDRRAEGAAAHILSAPLTPELCGALAQVSASELTDRIRALEALRQEARRRASQPVPSVPAAAPPPLAAVVAVILAGATLLATGLVGQGLAVAGIGVAVLAVGTWLAAQRRGLSSPAAPADAPAEASGAALAQREALVHVQELLDGIPVRPTLLDEPTEALTVSLQRAQELLRDRDERRREVEEIRSTLHQADLGASALAHALDRGAGLDAQALAHLLERELRQAERMAEAAAASARELQRLERERDRVEAEISQVADALSRLRSRLEEAGQGDLEQGAHILRQRIQARDRALQLQDELERTHPDLDEIRDRIRTAEEQGESWTADDDDLAHRKAAVEELTQRVEDLATRAESLDKDVTQLGGTATVDSIDGEIAALEEEQQSLLRERDRRWVMAKVLQEADRRFREEHQPDVLRRAGRHLHALTGGRYDHLAVDDASGVGRFQVGGPGLPAPIPLAPPVSTGTLEQAYLALRLAIVDHLDQGLERLPLFVDEILVNWDEGRRARGMSLLQSMAQRRQVFVFTCHDDLAAELGQKGATVLRLERNA